MARNRVLSLFSRFENHINSPTTPPSSTPASPTFRPSSTQQQRDALAKDASSAHAEQVDGQNGSSPTRHRRSFSVGGSRRNSLTSAYQPPTMDITDDTPPELQPIFTYLNSHSNKLYQEGYFLKLHDLDSRGRPSADRVWNECFAQLVGTVLSLWDAAELDAAGEDGEVIPTFINLTDASIKMIESLPMNSSSGQSLQNVLSISTAANNRYLLHFNSLHSLTQWTAGIRLAMFEHSTLQEAYTGAILAAKGKQLNGIRNIMERTRFPVEDWARVRFGVGTPWRRCWCVIRPPDEKEYAKAQKQAKKKSAYDRTPPVVKGDIKFYESRKITKKTKPIATITDAYAAYAIYPQAKPLIDQSTLVKVEGRITIHTNPESSTEGFVFVMPEVHPAVSGFEMMLRWLVPTFDTFALYGRPSRLIADVVDPRSLMFAMPTSKRYGYLELLDISGLIHADGSQQWNEREWKKQMKALTAKRMAASPADRAETFGSRAGSRMSNTFPSSSSRLSLNLPQSRPNMVKFGGDDSPARSGTAPSSRHGSPAPQGGFAAPPRTDSAPPAAPGLVSPSRQHQRAASDIPSGKSRPTRLSFEQNADDSDAAPTPPPHGQRPAARNAMGEALYSQHDDRSGDESEGAKYYDAHNGYPADAPIEAPFKQQALVPVAAPPAMAHGGMQKPRVRPADMPEMRRANSAIDAATLTQLAEANRAQRARSGSGSQDDLLPQQLPGSSVMAPHGNPNYRYEGPYGAAMPRGSSQHEPLQQYGGSHAANYHQAGPYNQAPPPRMNQGPPPRMNVPPQGGYRSAPNAGPPPTQNGGMLEPGRTARRGPPPPDARLPTIPGTPAYEQNQFDLPVGGGRPGTINRRPVGAPRTDSNRSRSREPDAQGRDPSPRPY